MSRFIILVLYVIFLILGPGLCTLNHFSKVSTLKHAKVVPDFMKERWPFVLCFFTVWNFGLQILFLLIAITDELSKLFNFGTIQKKICKFRLILFSSLVFPSTLSVTTIFWSVWHIDRELILPQAVDEYLPAHVNHILHTLIVLPLIVEVLVQFKNHNVNISPKRAAFTLGLYISIYQTLYLLIYYKHGIWLYPVYSVLDWTERIIFVIIQFALFLCFQQIGLYFLKTPKKLKNK